VALAPDVAMAQAIGQRQRQEDTVGRYPEDGPAALLVLSDGMGGAVGGNIASAIIVETVIEVFASAGGAPAGRLLRSAAHSANNAIAARVESEPELAGMGGTLVAVQLLPEGLMFFSMGDSPLYLVLEGEALRLNADHSVGGMLDAAVARGEITAEAALARRDRNAILSVIMGEPIERMRMDETVDIFPVARGDVLILASDGLDTITPAKVAEIVTATRTSAETAQALLAAVEAVGKPRQDNVSVIVARF
jgi:serine/threonine protein phosphatase PrpC